MKLYIIVVFQVFTSMQGFYSQFMPYNKYDGFMGFTTFEFDTVNFCQRSERDEWKALSYNRTWLWSMVNFTEALANEDDESRTTYTKIIENM